MYEPQLSKEENDNIYNLLNFKGAHAGDKIVYCATCFEQLPPNAVGAKFCEHNNNRIWNVTADDFDSHDFGDSIETVEIEIADKQRL